MRGRNSHKSKARQARRRAYRDAVTTLQGMASVPRETAVQMVEATGASWRDFGLPYTGFGSEPLGPPAPVRKSDAFVTDGVPIGTRLNPETGKREPTRAH